jgi:hypothetical protein
MSPTLAINTHLDLVAAVSAVWLVGIVLYRVVQLLVGMLLDAIPLFAPRADEAETPLKRFAVRGLVGAALQFGVTVLSVLARGALAMLRAAGWVLWTLLPMLCLALALVLVHERWSDTMLTLTSVMNGPGGDVLRWLVLTPLTLLDALGTYVFPIWNLLVLILFWSPLQLVAWLLSSSGAVELVWAARELGAAVPALVPSAEAFVRANARLECPLETCVPWRNLSLTAANDTNLTAAVRYEQTCTRVSLAVAAQACLDPRFRTFDFLPAMAHAQRASAHLVTGLSFSCRALWVLVHVALFPLTDPSMWYALDRALNAALFTIVGTPTSAALRCNMAGGFAKRPAMCTPDFAPAWALGSEAALALGDALTHWFKAAYMWLLQGQTAMQANTCSDATPYTAGLWPAAAVLFGSNGNTTQRRPTALVRLGDGRGFAVTDGDSVLWGQDLPRLRWTPSPQAWPFRIDVAWGVATVKVPGGGWGLLGCQCAPALRCAIIASENATQSWELPMEFSLAAETQLLTCERMRVSVQSVRWGRMRPSSLADSVAVGMSDADAAIYVVPICGGTGVQAAACLPSKTFTRGICFPYCMALHLVNEGVHRPITVRGASEWTQGLVLSGMDCASTTTTTTTTTTSDDKSSRTLCRVNADVASSFIADGAVDGNAQCTRSMVCTSVLPDKTVRADYATFTPRVGEDNGVRLVLDGQPLAIGGGIQLRAQTLSDGRVVYDFPSLVGNQANEFTIEPLSPWGVPLNQTPPLYVPKKKSSAHHGIPYNPGTLGRGDTLWFASNPSYDALSAFLDYCQSEGKSVEAQLVVLSNYAPPQVQRVVTAQDACYVMADDDASLRCRDDMLRVLTLPRALPLLTGDDAVFERLYTLCASGEDGGDARLLDLYVEGLEYWDEANIAVAVRRGTLRDLGVLMHSDSIAGATAYYFVSPLTMEARADVPWPNSPLSALTPSGLPPVTTCPLLAANVPDVGAVVGRSLSGTLHLLSTVSNAFFNPFAFEELLDARVVEACPDNALRHSALAECGFALLSLDGAFQEAYAASHAVWEIALWFVDLVFASDAGSVDILGRPLTAAVVRNFLQGLTVIGDATRVTTLFDIEAWLSSMDLNAQAFLEEGGMKRRRLLAKNGGGGGSKDKKSKGVMGYAHSGLMSGVRGFASLVNFVGSMLSGQLFAGADFGALLSTSGAHEQLAGAVFAAPPIAFAEFTYRVLMPLAVDVMASVKGGKPSVASIWQNIGASRDLFDTIVDARLRQACSGLRLMMGYDSQVGQALYWSCRTGADVAPAMLQVLSTVLSDVPLYRCLCVYPAGQVYLDYVQTHCLQYIPPTRKAYWQVRSFPPWFFSRAARGVRPFLHPNRKIRMLRDLTLNLLWLNGLWDLVCVVFMLLRLRAAARIENNGEETATTTMETPHLVWQTPHWSMWQRASDRTNPAARALFAGLVMLWGGVRLIGAVYLYDDTNEDKKEGVRLIVMWTYALESIMLSIAAATGQMREERAFVAAALCVPMLILLRLFAFDGDDYH